MINNNEIGTIAPEIKDEAEVLAGQDGLRFAMENQRKPRGYFDQGHSDDYED